MKNTDKKMELEDLAGMVLHGFEELRKDFRSDLRDSEDRLRKDFLGDLHDTENRLNSKIEVLDMRLSSYITAEDKEFDDLHEWVGELDSRVNKIEDKIVTV